MRLRLGGVLGKVGCPQHAFLGGTAAGTVGGPETLRQPGCGGCSTPAHYRRWGCPQGRGPLQWHLENIEATITGWDRRLLQPGKAQTGRRDMSLQVVVNGQDVP